MPSWPGIAVRRTAFFQNAYVPAIHDLLAAKDITVWPEKSARQQIQFWKDTPFLTDQRHAVKDYNLA
jgi:hypothetical protein